MPAVDDRQSLLPSPLFALLAAPVQARTLRRVDLALVVWTIAWVVIAVFVGQQVLALRDLGGTVVKAGVAVRTSGDTLGQLRGLPLLGSDLGKVASQAREAGRSAIISGRESQASVKRLALLLALAIGAIPTLPPLLLYLPFRMRWWRRSRAAAKGA